MATSRAEPGARISGRTTVIVAPAAVDVARDNTAVPVPACVYPRSCGSAINSAPTFASIGQTAVRAVTVVVRTKCVTAASVSVHPGSRPAARPAPESRKTPPTAAAAAVSAQRASNASKASACAVCRPSCVTDGASTSHRARCIAEAAGCGAATGCDVSAAGARARSARIATVDVESSTVTWPTVAAVVAHAAQASAARPGAAWARRRNSCGRSLGCP